MSEFIDFAVWTSRAENTWSHHPEKCPQSPFKEAALLLKVKSALKDTKLSSCPCPGSFEHQHALLCVVD